MDPVRGIPRAVSFLNLAAIAKNLDTWHGEHLDHERRVARPALPPPEVRDPEHDAKMRDQLRALSINLQKV